MNKKNFFGTCVENPFDSIDELSQIIDEAKEITKQTFLKRCNVDEKTKREINLYGSPSFYFYKYKNIYFFTWSSIEHFYI